MMTKPVLGLVVGGALGLLDGLSAWFSPEARPILLGIVIGSTAKGLVTGILAGLIARWKQSVALGVLSGLALGLAGSSLAALSQPDHYFEIVLPGMLVGAIVGFVTQRYPIAVRSAIAQRSLVLLAVTIVGSTLLASGVQSNAPPAAAPDRLAPLAVLLGRWVGTTEGRSGKGTVERDYVRLLGTRFVQVRNRSSYPPQENNPKGEVHEDMGVFSFDTSRKAIVFRQFHIEGFVSQYVLEPESTATRLVLTTESIENIPAGWRAGETYVVSGSNELEEVFELAEPGKPFEVYSRTRLTRVP
jgi:hypothetical protein